MSPYTVFLHIYLFFNKFFFLLFLFLCANNNNNQFTYEDLHGRKIDHLFVCVDVLRPSQPNRAMLSTVSLPNHTFTGQA